MDDEFSKVVLPERPADAHKYSCGSLLVLGGSATMPGAAALVGLSALRSGAGVVSVLTTPEAQPIVASFSPCLMVDRLWESIADYDAAKKKVNASVKNKQVLAVGPGLGRDPRLQPLVVELYETFPGCVVFDADGLNLLADARCILARHAGERILTPHLGEFRRLTGDTDLDIVAARQRVAEFAYENGVVTLLKGPRTRISDGQRSHDNPTGNAALATAGSGDVLTGIVAGLAAQGLEPWQASVSGAFLHGLAGELAAETFGQLSVIATDIIDHLPAAIKKCKRPAR